MPAALRSGAPPVTLLTATVEWGSISAFASKPLRLNAMKNERRPTSERVYRELSADEQRRLDQARARTAAARDAILAEAQARKRALGVSRDQLRRTVAALRAERERLGLSLADVQARSGLQPSLLSRLENDPAANPTCLTLQRYSLALGMRVEVTLRREGD